MAQKHWLALAARVWRLWTAPSEQTSALVTQSYDRIAPGYDDAWTTHMRDLTRVMLDKLAPPTGARCLDLACGTGFVAGELARRTGGDVIGVDASPGMLAAAQAAHGDAVTFVNADIVDYLAAQPPNSFDVIASGWALGYSRPTRVIREIARVLKPGGRVGIIDNSLFSLREVLWASTLAFAERPAALIHIMNVRFLPGAWALSALLRRRKLRVAASWGGAKTYYAPDGQAAIARLTATGAAAGFEFAADASDHDAVFARFAEIMERRYGVAAGVPVTHRYLAAIASKP